MNELANDYLISTAQDNTSLIKSIKLHFTLKTYKQYFVCCIFYNIEQWKLYDCVFEYLF